MFTATCSNAFRWSLGNSFWSKRKSYWSIAFPKNIICTAEVVSNEMLLFWMNQYPIISYTKTNRYVPICVWSISHVIPISRVWTYEIPVCSYKIMEYGANKLFQDVSQPPWEGLTLYFLFATAIKIAALSQHDMILTMLLPYSTITQTPRLVDRSAQCLRHNVNKISTVSALPVATWSWYFSPTNDCFAEIEFSII